MSVHIRTRHTRRSPSPSKRRAQREKTISWREVAKKDLEKHSEGGQMLRGSRFKKEVSQEELANALGISQHHISEMENGKRSIGKEMAKRFAAFFKTDYRLFL